MFPQANISRRLAITLVAATGLGVLGYVKTRADRPQIVQITADYPEFANLAAITKAADAVVLARFVSSHEELLLPAAKGGDSPEDPQRGVTLTTEQQREMAVPSTVSVLSVSKTLKGSLKPGQLIKVTQVGGTQDGQQVREVHTPLIGEFATKVPDQSFLLMLNRHGEIYDVLNPTMGIHGVDAQGSLIALDPATGETRPATSGTKRLTLKDLG